MNESTAREILKDFIRPHSHKLSSMHPYVSWFPDSPRIVLKGYFSTKQLQALAWWIEHFAEKEKPPLPPLPPCPTCGKPMWKMEIPPLTFVWMCRREGCSQGYVEPDNVGDC